LLLMTISCFISCTKDRTDPTVPCTQNLIKLSVISSTAMGCTNYVGSISVSATGSGQFTFSLNAGLFQKSGNFSNLKNGTYNITARDADGCEESTTAYVASGITAGPKFQALKNLFVLKCNRCHGGQSPAALKDWSVDCVIIDNRELINNRAVIIGDMPRGGPELSTAEKEIITGWLAAGGLIEN